MARLVKNAAIDVNQEQLAFYFEVGLTLTQWASLERALLYVAAACLGNRNWSAVSAGFFRIENFRSKLQFVDEVVRAKVKRPTLLTEWGRLEGKVRDLSSDRNQLAHRPVMGYPEAPPGGRYVLRARFEKEPRRPERHDRPPASAMGVFDVADLRMRAFDITLKLENFAAAVARRKRPFQVSAHGRLPVTADQILQTLSALARTVPR